MYLAEDQERESFPARLLLLVVANGVFVALMLRYLLEGAREFEYNSRSFTIEVGRWLR